MDEDHAEQTRRCPYCGDEISVTTTKCRHCGEWLSERPAEVAAELGSADAVDEAVSTGTVAKGVFGGILGRVAAPFIVGIFLVVVVLIILLMAR